VVRKLSNKFIVILFITVILALLFTLFNHCYYSLLYYFVLILAAEISVDLDGAGEADLDVASTTANFAGDVLSRALHSFIQQLL